MICLSILLEMIFGLSFRINEVMYLSWGPSDSQQMLSRDIIACSSQENALHLRIHRDPQNHLPYLRVYCYCFQHISQKMNDLFRVSFSMVLCHAERYPEVLIISD
jgi:hypothetical protein